MNMLNVPVNFTLHLEVDPSEHIDAIKRELVTSLEQQKPMVLNKLRENLEAFTNNKLNELIYGLVREQVASLVERQIETLNLSSRIKEAAQEAMLEAAASFNRKHRAAKALKATRQAKKKVSNKRVRH